MLYASIFLLSMNPSRAATTYSLTLTKTGTGQVNSAPSGINCGTRCKSSFTRGATVTLWSTPISGYTFAGWGGACSGTGNCVVTMNAAKVVSAAFTKNTDYVLKVTNTGHGTLTSAPAGIVCGSTCSYNFTNGNTVTLWATPDTGYRFVGWGGDCSGTGDCVLTMNSNKNLTAGFTQNATFSLGVSKTGNGTITSIPTGINCGTACGFSFTSGDTVTLTATPESGNTFSGWGGSCSGAEPCTLKMDGAKTVNANFSVVNTPPPPADLPSLKRGINLSHWLTHYGRQPVVKDDLVMIKNAGFDHVRIAFDPGYLGWNPDDAENPGLLPLIAKLDVAINLAIDNGLVAMVDFHPNSSLKTRIETEASVQSAFVKLWETLANRYQSKPGGSIVYELMNEPQYWTSGPTAWYELRQKALSAVRAKDAKHLVLISGGYGGGLRGIVESPVVTDNAVAYTFHYYEPYLFTHNGAPWEPHLSQVEDMFTGLLYPASLNSMDNIVLKSGANNTVVSNAINDYKSQGWGYQRILSDISGVKTWAANHGNAKVYCNEFGVLRLTQDETSRSNYLKDVRTAVESAGMGWTVFDYADIFGIAKATGSTYLSGDGATIPSDPANPHRIFTGGNLDALLK